MRNKYSIFSLFKNALSYHENWQRAWKDPAPKKEYDAVIIGGGGHGLATAYYLAKKHNMQNIAVVEKGWIGGGNTGRNTTIIRSNYLWDESAALYNHAVNLWEGLSSELNYNVMFSQRGLFHLAHTVHDMQEITRRGYSNHLNGIDAEILNKEQVLKNEFNSTLEIKLNSKTVNSTSINNFLNNDQRCKYKFVLCEIKSRIINTF